MELLSLDDPCQESTHSLSPQSRATASSPSSQALSLLTSSPNASISSPFVFTEPLPDSWYITEPLSDPEEYRLQQQTHQDAGPHASSPPLPPLPSSLQPSPHSSDAVTMSAAVALQFDPLFGMGSRPSYSSWPVIDSNSGLLGQDLSSYGSDISLSPPSGSRSVTASPPRYPVGLTAQQREIKRQRDQARREAKFASRRRAGSGELPDASVLGGIDAVASYATTTHSTRNSGDVPVVSGSSRSSISSISLQPSAVTTAASSPGPYMQSPPPVTMANMSSVSSASSSLPVAYTTSAPQMSLLSEPVTTASSASLTSPSYMSAAAPYSPPLPSHASQDVFSQSYQQPQYLSDYTTAGYSHAAPTTLHSQYPRGSMQDQPGMLYQMPPLPPPTVHSMMGHGSLHSQQQQQQQQQQQAPPQHAPLPHLVQHPHPHPHQHVHGLPSVPLPHDGIPSGVRVVQSRPKPQCWEHGCNGRQFSTFSNLLRHQREKSGQAAKAVCPNCGAEFTRTTARNGHLAHDKCKPRRNT